MNVWIHVFWIFFYSLFHIMLFQSIKPITHKEAIQKPSVQLLGPKMNYCDLKYSLPQIYIDMGTLEDQITILHNYQGVIINLFYAISAPTKAKPTLKNLFCHVYATSEPERCFELKQDSYLQIQSMKTKVLVTNNSTAFQLILTSYANQDMSGLYYFKSTTISNGIIISNAIEIRDSLYWSVNLLSSSMPQSKETYMEPLQPAMLPTAFPCLQPGLAFKATRALPYWIQLEVTSLVHWLWCPVARQQSKLPYFERTFLSKCLDYYTQKRPAAVPAYLQPRVAHDMLDVVTSIDFDGTMNIIHGTGFRDMNSKLHGYGLLCYFDSGRNRKAIKFIAGKYSPAKKEFLEGLRWVEGRQPNDFKIVLPLLRTVFVGIMKKGFVLQAIYGAAANSTYQWLHNNRPVINNSYWASSPYFLTYDNTVTFDVAGLYVLKLRSSREQHEYKFQVRLLHPPSLLSMNPIIRESSVYLLVNSNFKVSFTFRMPVEKIDVYINGVKYVPGFFVDDMAKASYCLKDLDFNISQQHDSANGTLVFTYEVRKLKFCAINLQTQDHTLIVNAVNIFGFSRTHLKIYVLRPPIYSNYPAEYNCSQSCFSTQPHLFRCQFNEDYFREREVKIEKSWLVNGSRIDTLPYYKEFFVAHSEGLTVKPIRSEYPNWSVAAKLLLQNARLTCRLRLMYPNSLATSDMTEDRLRREQRVIYDSAAEPSLTSLMSTDINIDHKPNIQEANFSWIVFLVIALLLIAMFIFLLIKFTMRDSGKSYPIEKMEIAKGIDRQGELDEYETIKPYMRNEGSRAFDNSNLDTTDDHSFKPSDNIAEIDDEVDEFAIETTKFNEEGSFIGVYSSKERPNGNQIPSIRTNNHGTDSHL